MGYITQSSATEFELHGVNGSYLGYDDTIFKSVDVSIEFLKDCVDIGGVRFDYKQLNNAILAAKNISPDDLKVTIQGSIPKAPSYACMVCYAPCNYASGICDKCSKRLDY